MDQIRFAGQKLERNTFSLDIPEIILGEGENLAIIGKNGAGKSTYLQAIHKNLDRKFCFLAQDTFIVELYSVYLNMYASRLDRYSFFKNLKNLFFNDPQEKREAKEILSKLGIENKVDQKAGSLSGGERKKMALARSIFGGCKHLIADEPLSALAERDHENVLNFLFQEFSTSVIILHHLDYLPLFKKVLIIENGKMHFFGDSGDQEVKKWQR
jgi:phosphonate transport system ATP-binding protein